MKDYNDYMDNISVDQELHNKIINRVTKKPSVLGRNRLVFRYAGMVACVVILLLGIWAIPGMFHNPAVNSLSYQDGAPENSFLELMSLSGLNPESLPLHPLTFNTGAPMPIVFADRIVGAVYGLTDEQVNAVFPDFGLPLIVTAQYSCEGSLIEVTAVVSTQIMQVWDETFLAPVEHIVFYYPSQATQIRIGRDRLFDCICLEAVLFPHEISYVYGVSVTAFMDEFGEGADRRIEFRADFMLEDLAYRVSFEDRDREAGKARLTEVVNRLILGGPADLSVVDNLVTPELRFEWLDIDEARLDPDFGAFLPVNIPPEGFTPYFVNKAVTPRENSLSVHVSRCADWSTSTIAWRISEATEDDLARIVSVEDHEKYDLSLYPIPRAASVPEELWQFVFAPVFLAEELTLDVIRARTFWLEEEILDHWTNRWPAGWRMNFSVLYDDVLVHVSASGPFPEFPDLPEQIWEMLSEIELPERPSTVQWIFEQIHFVFAILILLVITAWLIRFKIKSRE